MHEGPVCVFHCSCLHILQNGIQLHILCASRRYPHLEKMGPWGKSRIWATKVLRTGSSNLLRCRTIGCKILLGSDQDCLTGFIETPGSWIYFSSGKLLRNSTSRLPLQLALTFFQLSRLPLRQALEGRILLSPGTVFPAFLLLPVSEETGMAMGWNRLGMLEPMPAALKNMASFQDKLC